ncbi:uncharacterized protein MONOS_17921 [Monocercomonoides exilis]|uniref:uncharacterized protein n=1 Tax=Monocercomonoides exilis TaxID=2049356 RepID=UPI00355AB52C|nr:hypothetical protein MONOS_17921 [Monocercomonoides exilis]
MGCLRKAKGVKGGGYSELGERKEQNFRRINVGDGEDWKKYAQSIHSVVIQTINSQCVLIKKRSKCDSSFNKFRSRSMGCGSLPGRLPSVCVSIGIKADEKY